jgi:hypothetical protein
MEYYWSLESHLTETYGSLLARYHSLRKERDEKAVALDKARKDAADFITEMKDAVAFFSAEIHTLRDALAKEKKEYDAVRAQCTCIICMITPRTIVCLGCRNLSLCEGCAAKTAKCPLCNGDGTNTRLKIVMS